MGKKEKARDSLVSSEISPLYVSTATREVCHFPTHMMHFSTATFPFIIPFKLRVMTSVQKLLLNPKATAEMEEPTHPCL